MLTKEDLDKFTESEVRAAYLDMDRQLTELMQRTQQMADAAVVVEQERHRWKADFERESRAYAAVYEELQTLKRTVPQTSPNPVPHDDCG